MVVPCDSVTLIVCRYILVIYPKIKYHARQLDLSIVGASHL